MAFNPQVDRQAEDRCHRLGQEKQVTVYKLIMENSCEEHIHNMAEEKKQLNDLMLEEGDWKKLKKLSGAEVQKVMHNVFSQESEPSILAPTTSCLKSKTTHTPTEHTYQEKNTTMKNDHSKIKKEQKEQQSLNAFIDLLSFSDE